MRYFCVLFAVILVSNVLDTQRSPSTSNKQNNNLRSNRASTQRPSTTTKRNPCVTYKDPPKPNFKRHGLRLSMSKCLEYVWERSRRYNKTKQKTECDNFNGHYYVLGGRDALFGEFPHMGGIGWKTREGTWLFMCGCSLISSKFTLTAAHCTKSRPDTRLVNTVPEIVRVGAINIMDAHSDGYNAHTAKILKIIVHPGYKPPGKYFDIALIEIMSVWEFRMGLHPACLWGQSDTSKLGTSATLTGWGVVNIVTKKSSQKLQAAVIDILDSGYCNNSLRDSCNRHWCGMADHQICGGKKSGNVDSCQGDSGGPLQVKIPLEQKSEGSMHFIIGVTSFGIGCGRPGQPGVYTRVSSFIDWIESIVWKDGSL